MSPRFPTPIRRPARTSRMLGVLGLALPAFLAFEAAAQTPAQLKARFAEVLGSGVHARIAWQAEGRPNRKPNFDITGNPSSIQVMDTRDGIVRTLAGPKAGTHYSGASLTYDGTRVVWTDNVKLQYLVCDFLDSTKKKVILNGFEGDGRTYRSQDGKDWVIATEAKNKGMMYRVNIDDPAERIPLYQTTTNRTGWAGASCWAQMSPDGKRVAGGFPNYGDLGWLDVAAKKVTRLQEENGCWPNIARDNSGDMLYCPTKSEGSQVEDSHQAIRIVNLQEKELARPNLLAAGYLGNKPKSFYESLRWSANRDIITLFAYYNDGEGTFQTAGYPNPRIINLKTKKMIAINDNPETPEGNADIWFSSGVTGMAPLLPVHPDARLQGVRVRRAVDLRGRSLSDATKPAAGILFGSVVESRAATLFLPAGAGR